MDQAFEQGVNHIFHNWSALKTAVDQAWGGANSRGKRDELIVRTISLFRPGRDRRIVEDSHTFGDWLTMQVMTLFNCELEDESEIEVAEMTMALFEGCQAGDLTVLKNIMSSTTSCDSRYLPLVSETSDDESVGHI